VLKIVICIPLLLFSGWCIWKAGEAVELGIRQLDEAHKITHPNEELYCNESIHDKEKRHQNEKDT